MNLELLEIWKLDPSGKDYPQDCFKMRAENEKIGIGGKFYHLLFYIKEINRQSSMKSQGVKLVYTNDKIVLK